MISKILKSEFRILEPTCFQTIPRQIASSKPLRYSREEVNRDVLIPMA